MSDDSVPSELAPSPSLAPVLGLSAIWAAEVAFTVPGVPPGTGFVATLGTAAVTLVAMATVFGVRGARVSPWIRGTLLVSGPLAVLATTLREKTHHRALGGVTFAVVAAALVAGGVFTVRRLDQLALRRVTTALLTGSLLVAIRPFLTARSGPDALALRDLVMFAALSSAAVALERRRVGDGLQRVARPAFWVVAIFGLVLSGLSLPLRAILAERAPFAFGIGALLGP